MLVLVGALAFLAAFFVPVMPGVRDAPGGLMDAWFEVPFAGWRDHLVDYVTQDVIDLRDARVWPYVVAMAIELMTALAALLIALPRHGPRRWRLLAAVVAVFFVAEMSMFVHDALDGEPIAVDQWLIATGLFGSLTIMLGGLLARLHSSDDAVAWWLVLAGAPLAMLFTSMPDWAGIAPLIRGGTTESRSGAFVEWGGAPRAAAILVNTASLLGLAWALALWRRRPQLATIVVCALLSGALAALLISAHWYAERMYVEWRAWMPAEAATLGLDEGNHRLMLAASTATFVGAWLLIAGAIVQWRFACGPVMFARVTPDESNASTTSADAVADANPARDVAAASDESAAGAQ